MEAYIEPGNDYVVEAWRQALAPLNIKIHSSVEGPSSASPGSAGKLCLLYQDYDNYDFDTRDAQAEWVYSYVYRKALTRKNYLGNTILHYRAKRPQSVLHTAWPDSFNLEVDYPEFLDDALDESWDLKQELAAGGKTWILKPALGERAHGIRIFETQADLQQIFDETLGSDEEDEEGNGSEMREYVVQQYVTDPLLIDGRKFHVRVYCLCVGRLQVYVNEHMLALFSGTPYDAQDFGDLRSHLTNTCFQGSEAEVAVLEDKLPARAATKVVNAICDVVHDLFEAAQGDAINFQSLSNAFELFGLDFLVTNSLDVKLLEVNAYPDFKQTGSRLRFVVDNLFKDTASILFNEGKDVSGLRRVL